MFYCPQFKFIAILSQSVPVSSKIGGVLSLSLFFINPVEQKWETLLLTEDVKHGTHHSYLIKESGPFSFADI